MGRSVDQWLAPSAREVCFPQHKVRHNVLSGLDHVSAVGRLAARGFRSLEELGSRRVRVTLVHAHGSRVARQITALTAGLIDRRPHPASRCDLVVELTLRGQEIVHAVTAHRREEIARVVHNMPQRERYGLVSTLTAFTTAGGEPQPVSKSKAGESAALIFTKVDRASRCTEDFARLLRLSEEQYDDDDRRYR